MRRLRFTWPTLFVALLAPATPVAAQAEVTIYRCVDAQGRLALRDTPCRKGERQETRTMVRPKDAPPRPDAAAPSPAPTRGDTTPTRVLVAYPPRPMYECVTPDGDRYTSDSPEGNPRWVPLWTLGYPAFGRPPRIDAGRGSFRPAPSISASIGKPQQQLPPPTGPAPGHHPAPWPTASGGGTWVRDDCAMLPPRETCARLRDRREQIRARFFNAMPSERDVLRAEERTINARLDNDCDR